MIASPSTPPTTPPTMGPTFEDDLEEAGAVVWDALAEEEDEMLELTPGLTAGVGPPAAEDSAASMDSDGGGWKSALGWSRETLTGTSKTLSLARLPYSLRLEEMNK